MPSLVITAHDYQIDPTAAENQGPFTRRFLAEGDSWMDKSSPLTPSLPTFLGWEFDRRGERVLIINIAHGGDELQRITDTMNNEFAWWMRQFTYDAILFSAGGNDFIDAAREKVPGTGLLRDMRGQPTPADGYACVDPAALKLLQGYLATNFGAIYALIRRDRRNARTPIYLNCYDTPTARNAPAISGVGPWLYEAYTKNGIDPSVWPSLTAGLFRDIQQTISAWAFDATGLARTGVVAVPTTGVLAPAQAGQHGDSGDWVNEIHPDASGWAKLAKVWADTLTRQGA